MICQPTLTIRLFSPAADMWLQLVLETETDFWRLVECLGMATKVPDPQNEEDHAAFLEDVEYLLNIAPRLEEYMEASISSLAESKMCTIAGIVGTILLAFVFGTVFCNAIAME